MNQQRKKPQMRITCVTNIYPSSTRPHHGTFVKEFMIALARQGVRCTVVYPNSIFDRRYGRLNPTDAIEYSDCGGQVRVLRPRFVSASTKQIGGFNTDVITQHNFEQVVEKTFIRLAPETDLVYGHFFYPSGRAVAKLGRKFSKPSVVAHGDGTIADWNLTRGVRDFRGISGVVAVSQRNRVFCEEVFRIPSRRIRVFPNGVDLSSFHPRDKRATRRRLGLPEDRFLAIFVGHLIDGKGPNRVLDAVEQLDGVNVMFVGTGPIKLESPKIVFTGAVEHSRLPDYLSAADIFVLPTLDEGCCNAILEAMACGLPIISSKGEFNDEIIDDDVSIRVDPLNTQDIKQAIDVLAKNDSLRTQMGLRSLERSKLFSVETRAQRMLDWMLSLVRYQCGPSQPRQDSGP